MGRKITIDSATLFNKGLEVIEARSLLDIATTRVEWSCTRKRWCTRWSSSSMARLSRSWAMPDMCLPISYALAYPERGTVGYGVIDWATLGALEFATPDHTTFRCLDLAYAAGHAGGTAPARLSAANEVAVDAFLRRILRWTQIADVCTGVLEHEDGGAGSTLDEVVAADDRARADHVATRRFAGILLTTASSSST